MNSKTIAAVMHTASGDSQTTATQNGSKMEGARIEICNCAETCLSCKIGWENSLFHKPCEWLFRILTWMRFHASTASLLAW